MKALSESTILITGATSGLGKMTAERFSQAGAKVLLHGRNQEKGQKVLEEIQTSTGNQKLEYFNADLSSLQSTVQLAEDLISSGVQIDILINNAGLGGSPETKEDRQSSSDGFELIWAVNYLAPVLLTRKLLPIINEDARIINVASVAQTELDFDDLNMEKYYDSYTAYARSKLALIMFTFDLADEVKDQGIIVNALHPSTLMDTDMAIDHFGGTQSTVEEGFEAVKHLAASEKMEGVTGEYFNGKTQTKAIEQAYDEEAREQLKRVTEDAIESYF